MNRVGLGVCLVGNFDQAAAVSGIWGKALELVRYLMDEHEIPRGDVIGHREAGLMAGYDWERGQYKTCPGRRFSMDDFRMNL